MAGEAGLHPQLLDAVMKINDDQRQVVIQKLEVALGGAGSLDGKTVAVLGLAFKDNTDDMREAPSIDIITWLLERGANVRSYDPEAVETARGILPDYGITYCADEYDAATGADAIAIVTEWTRFRGLDMERLRSVMRDPANAPLIDGKNLYDPEEMARLGYNYQGIGRGVERRNGNGHNGASQPQQAPQPERREVVGRDLTPAPSPTRRGGVLWPLALDERKAGKA